MIARILLLALLLASSSAWASDVKIEDAFSPRQGATALVVNAIHSAHKSIRVAAYLMTSHPIANALIKAGHSGVDVKVLLDQQQCDASHGSLDGYLTENGVAVRKNDHYNNMHDKFMVIDDSVLELGSFNYTRAAEEENAENVLVIRGAPEIAKDYREQWERLWGEGR